MAVHRVLDWERLSAVFDGGRKIVLFLDYDGTLVPIRKKPDACVLPDRIRRLLRKLSASGRCCPIILSGRSLSNIKKMVGVRGICYGGNHGFEIAGHGIRYTHKAALKARPAMLEAKRLLKNKIRGIKGAFVEDKKFSISLHYRSVGEKAIPTVFKHFEAVALPLVNKKKLNLIKGKMVLELVPNAEWNKGLAALWLLERLGGDFFPVYVGDDTTDETAFKALRKNGLTVKVGEGNRTHARYLLEKSSDVIGLLDKISHMVSMSA